MMNHSKYRRQYYLPPYPCLKWAQKDYVDKAPVWCSVDLRDGNQALVVPMTLEQKIGFFKLLCKVGFKEIEVGFPAASETIQVLTQAREHIIRKTFEALEGVKQAIVHVYNSTSVAQREQVFHKSKEEILKIVTARKEVHDPHNLKTRRIGSAIAVDIHIRLDGSMTVAESHDITVEIERRLRERFGPSTIVSIHVEPIKPAPSESRNS